MRSLPKQHVLHGNVIFVGEGKKTTHVITTIGDNN
jgi:hypothetical protein